MKRKPDQARGGGQAVYPWVLVSLASPTVQFAYSQMTVFCIDMLLTRTTSTGSKWILTELPSGGDLVDGIQRRQMFCNEGRSPER